MAIENFPKDLQFGHPSSYGISSLKKILDNAENISFKCRLNGTKVESANVDTLK